MSLRALWEPSGSAGDRLLAFFNGARDRSRTCDLLFTSKRDTHSAEFVELLMPVFAGFQLHYESPQGRVEAPPCVEGSDQNGHVIDM